MELVLEKLILDLRGGWRFRWLAVVAAWAAALLGWGAVWVQPRSYESHARLYVDADSVLKPLLAGLAVGTDVRSRVAMMAKVVLSRPALEKVARDSDLYLRARDPEQLDSLVRSLGRKISLLGSSDGIYTISYSDADPKAAQRVVQAVLNSFVELTLGVKREDSSTAQAFLKEQLREYEAKLGEAEDRLADFKRKNVGLMPGQAGDYYTRLQGALTTLEAMKAKQRQFQERRSELQRQLEGEEPTFGLVLPAAHSGRNDAKIVELKARLDALLVQYTEKHPEIIALRETIARLEAENAQQKENRNAAASPSAFDPSKLALKQLDINPVYQNMKIALSQTDAELAEIRSQIAGQENEVAILRSRVNTVPEVEAQLARLNRDYEVNRAEYSALLQRMESARISQQVEESTDDLKFRIVEPPITALAPSGPSRGLLLTAVFFASLAVGAAVAILANRLRPIFSTSAVLKDATGLPVLGSISTIPELLTVPWYRNDVVQAGSALAVFLLAYVGNLALA